MGYTAQEEIKNLIESSIKKLQKDKFLPIFKIPKIFIEHPEDKFHGDYAVNIALILAKQLKRNPMEIAEMISQNFWVKQSLELSEGLQIKRQGLFKKIEIKNPGFINFFLSKEYLIKEARRILKEKDKYGSNKIGKGKIMVIDYSSPNIARPFGIGHLRSTIIGQAIYNIYQFLGWKCIGINHLGDWGTQYGKLIYQIREKKLKNKTAKEKAEILKKLTINDLEKLYVNFHKKSQIDEKLEEKARDWFKKLENKDKEAQKIWQACRDISLKEFNRIYHFLEIKIDYCL